MKKFLAGAALVALVASPISATIAATPVMGSSLAVGAEDAALTLPAGIPIKFVVAQDVSSTTHFAGDMFKLTVLDDVKIGDVVVIPRGTPAFAEITWRTGKGAFGKSGKLEFSLRYIELNNQRIPISGDFRQEGEGNTIATGVGVIAVGVFAGFITGKRAKLPVGRELMGMTAVPVPFAADGRLGAGYDGGAAMASIEATSPLANCKASAERLPENKQEKARKKCYTERMD